MAIQNNHDVSAQLLETPQEESKITTSSKKSPICFSKRLLVTTIILICFIADSTMRTSLNITIVQMTANQSITIGNHTITQPPEFNWDTTLTGFIISVSAYGVLFSFLGGLPVKWFGGSVGCALCLLANSINNILHPLMLQWNFYAFLVCRFLNGLLSTLFFASTADIFSRWIPKNEKSTLISYSFSGTNIGIAMTYPYCGYIAHNWGWRMTYYVPGISSLISSLICLIFVKNQPSQDPSISKEELAYILEGTDNHNKDKVTHPYKYILISPAVWALCILRFSFTWIAISILGAFLPIYIYGGMLHPRGLISLIPNMVHIFMFPIAGRLMDYWKTRSNISTTKMHKIIVSTAFMTSAVIFFVTVLVSNFIASLVFFVLIQIMTSFVGLLQLVIAVSLAPDSASCITGWSSFFSGLSAIVSRTTIGFMITNQSMQEWNNSFLLSGVLCAIAAVTFLVYGSSEIQPWASLPTVNRRNSVVSR